MSDENINDLLRERIPVRHEVQRIDLPIAGLLPHIGTYRCTLFFEDGTKEQRTITHHEALTFDLLKYDYRQRPENWSIVE